MSRNRRWFSHEKNRCSPRVPTPRKKMTSSPYPEGRKRSARQCFASHVFREERVDGREGKVLSALGRPPAPNSPLKMCLHERI
ncbi:hypothetical protein OF83DRAFT_62446 [Amylostereum chailletii]|nr:hypothetical protein OF83DRAFT_62446 [Amylostereum chailletii]